MLKWRWRLFNSWMLKVSFSCVSSLDRRTHYWMLVLLILCFCARAQKNMASKFKGHAYATNHEVCHEWTFHHLSLKVLDALVNSCQLIQSSYMLNKIVEHFSVFSQKSLLTYCSSNLSRQTIPSSIFLLLLTSLIELKLEDKLAPV